MSKLDRYSKIKDYYQRLEDEKSFEYSVAFGRLNEEIDKLQKIEKELSNLYNSNHMKMNMNDILNLQEWTHIMEDKQRTQSKIKDNQQLVADRLEEELKEQMIEVKKYEKLIEKYKQIEYMESRERDTKELDEIASHLHS